MKVRKVSVFARVAEWVRVNVLDVGFLHGIVAVTYGLCVVLPTVVLSIHRKASVIAGVGLYSVHFAKELNSYGVLALVLVLGFIAFDVLVTVITAVLFN